MKCPECKTDFTSAKYFLLDNYEYCSVRCINSVIKREDKSGDKKPDNRKFKKYFNYNNKSSERTLNMIRNTRESLKLKFKQEEEGDG